MRFVALERVLAERSNPLAMSALCQIWIAQFAHQRDDFAADQRVDVRRQVGKHFCEGALQVGEDLIIGPGPSAVMKRW
jgi:hypothetical protein